MRRRKPRTSTGGVGPGGGAGAGRGEADDADGDAVILECAGCPGPRGGQERRVAGRASGALAAVDGAPSRRALGADGQQNRPPARAVRASRDLVRGLARFPNLPEVGREAENRSGRGQAVANPDFPPDSSATRRARGCLPGGLARSPSPPGGDWAAVSSRLSVFSLVIGYFQRHGPSSKGERCR